MKLYIIEFRRNLEIVALPGLWRKFWAHFHDLCVQKRSCLLWSSDVFWKFSIFKVYKKISGRIFTIFTSKNKAVCREVQTDFRSFSCASFIKRKWVHFLDFCIQNWSCLFLSSDAFWTFSPDEVLKKVLGAFSRFMHPKMKLFAVKLRFILEVFGLRGL